MIARAVPASICPIYFRLLELSEISSTPRFRRSPSRPPRPFFHPRWATPQQSYSPSLYIRLEVFGKASGLGAVLEWRREDTLEPGQVK